jgi:hypothetical protein
LASEALSLALSSDSRSAVIRCISAKVIIAVDTSLLFASSTDVRRVT